MYTYIIFDHQKQTFLLRFIVNGCNETRINSHLHNKTHHVFLTHASHQVNVWDVFVGSSRANLYSLLVHWARSTSAGFLPWHTTGHGGHLAPLGGLRTPSKCKPANNIIHTLYCFLQQKMSNINLWQVHKKTSILVSKLKHHPSHHDPSPTWLILDGSPFHEASRTFFWAQKIAPQKNKHMFF